MCFLLHNQGIVGKESWTYLGLFQSFLFSCRWRITENTQSKKCAVFCEQTAAVRSCEVAIFNCKQLLSLCTPSYKPACRSWIVCKWDTFVRAEYSVRQFSSLLFYQCKLMRAAKAGTCTYQQFRYCSTVGSASCLVAVDMCSIILSCMGSWEMFQVLFIISQSIKLRLKECGNSTSLVHPLESRWVMHSNISNSAFGRGWTGYCSEVFSVPISYGFCLKKTQCSSPSIFMLTQSVCPLETSHYSLVV